jgi:hypothetical protein
MAIAGDDEEDRTKHLFSWIRRKFCGKAEEASWFSSIDPCFDLLRDFLPMGLSPQSSPAEVILNWRQQANSLIEQA